MDTGSSSTVQCVKAMPAARFLPLFKCNGNKEHATDWLKTHRLYSGPGRAIASCSPSPLLMSAWLRPVCRQFCLISITDFSPKCSPGFLFGTRAAWSIFQRRGGWATRNPEFDSRGTTASFGILKEERDPEGCSGQCKFPREHGL